MTQQQQEAVVQKKVEVLANAEETTATIKLHGEDHTFGNTIRYILATQPTTDFVGYSIPHPSEHVIHLRLQTAPPSTVRPALAAACSVLEEVCDVMMARFDEAVARAVKEGRVGGGLDEGDEEEEADHQMEEID